MTWAQHFTELEALPPTRLGDADALGALLVAAAGAMGATPLAPPAVRAGPGCWTAALLCADGHIVLHTWPDDGCCLENVASQTAAAVERGFDVITRRLGATVSP